MLIHITVHRIFFVILIFASHAIFCIDPIHLLFESSQLASSQEIEAQIPQPFLLETLSFDCNSYIDHEEISYLLSFREGDTINAQQLASAINHLQLKNRFESIEVSIASGVVGNHLHLQLHSFWACKKVKIRGWLHNKEKYRSFYLIEPGEKFDETKHVHSIKKIKDHLHAEGYLNAQVAVTVSEDPIMRTKSVDIAIKKGKKVTIKNVRLRMLEASDASESKCDHSSSDLRRRLYKQFAKPLKRTTYTKSGVQEALAALKEHLLHEGYFGVEVHADDVSVHPDNTMDFTISIDLAGKRAFFFLGNHFLSAKELHDLIYEFGKSAWLVPAEILSDEIAKAYHKKGFWFARIHATDEGERYLFVIDEGVRVKIEDVKLCVPQSTRDERKNENVSSTNLFCENKNPVRPELMEGLLKKSIFSPILESEFYDEKKVTQSLNALRSHYHRNGYIDVAIIDCDYQSGQDSSKQTLIITVDEGPQWILKEVSIPGYSELELNELFRAREVPFNAEQLEAQRAFLINYFTSQGYTGVRVIPEIKKVIDSFLITIHWIVQKGDQARFGQTVLRGTTRLPLSYIARELQYQPGDGWSSDAIKKSFMRLKDLEIFESIQLHQSQTSGPVEKTMVLKLIEDDPFEVRVRAGLEMQYIQEYRTFGGLTYKVGGSFLAKNQLNRADLVRFDLDFARSHFEIYASYRQPWFFSIPLRTMLQLYAIKHDQPGFVGNTNNLYRLTQYGGLLNVGRKNDYLDASVNFGFEWMETKLNEPTRLFAAELARAMNFDIRLLDKNVPFFLVEPTVLLDFVDNNLYPRKGSLTLLSLKGMIPLRAHESSSFFIKLLLEQTIYFPLDIMVLALRLRMGHIFYQEFSAIMPSERFYLGGSQSVRSYNADLAPPLGVFHDSKGKEMIVPRGGKTMVNGNIELRIPVHGALDGVLFQDLGMLSSDNFATFKARDVLAGTGFGVRLKTPIGPLRFDVGFKWRKDVPTQPRWAWTFMFGQAY